jgi:hypothetical protein
VNIIPKKLLALLQQRPHTETVTNPYRLPHRSANLGNYLEAMADRRGRRILVIGEALGYRGGLGTGIPISSCGLFEQASHPFLRRLAQDIHYEGELREATASMVWEYLADRRTLPLFWNAFPFHPHRRHEPESNRGPTQTEICEGLTALQLLAAWHRPERIAGLGRLGTRAAQIAFPDRQIFALRHPSYGGKQEFIRGMDRLLAR